MSSDDLTEAVADLGEGGVPGDRLELTTPLRALPAQRMEDAVRAVDPFFVVFDFDAKTATRERVVRITADAYHTPIPYRGQHGAGIGTIVRTGA
jgi:hypothetical protein